MKDKDKHTTESGRDLIELNGTMVNDILKTGEAKESFSLLAHLANGAVTRDLPRMVDKTSLNNDDKFVVAALVVTASAFCYDIVRIRELEPILGGTDGWNLLSEALGIGPEEEAEKPKEEKEKEDVSK